ncbi:MAG TPA: beta-N-acetylhexosaminidase [Oscillospiraceae bacterium]|nr:beta-N-acetylhexosaminidase [Oscillospiraceae bacterium]
MPAVSSSIKYKKNISSSTQLLSLLNQLKETNSSNNIPLFLSVDEEGGNISRMPAELEKLPANQVIGAVNNPTFSYQVGQTLAAQLKAYGFNLNFAPVLDINSNPLNPVIGDRSFGHNPEIVSKLGVETIKGLQSGGVIPVGKHFPGHGDTAIDSHLGLPIVNYDLTRLKNFELLPFQAAIEQRVEAIMIAHLLLPQLDDQYPASMSKVIITDLLKTQLNFQGLVVTDDMTMGAIVENYPLGQAVVQAVKAGSDLILVCHDYVSQLTAFTALKNAVTNGTIPEEQINASVYKILKLKQKYQISDQPLSNVDLTAINTHINDLLDTYLPTNLRATP